MPNHFLILLNWFCLLDPNIFFQVLLPFQAHRFADSAPRGWATCCNWLRRSASQRAAVLCRAVWHGTRSQSHHCWRCWRWNPWRGHSIIPTCRHLWHYLSIASVSHMLPSPFQVSKTSRALRQRKNCSCLWPLDWRRRGIWWVFLSLPAVGSQAESSR